MPLITDHRPPTLAKLAGNKVVKSTLKSKLDLPKDKRPRVILLTGPKGCGKTTTARIISSYLNCFDRDFTEIDATDDSGGVAAIRELKRTVRYPPLKGEVRIWFIDESHMLTPKAQEAFLKMLEEPPDYAHFILATTDPQKLIKTLKDRCLHLEMKPLDKKEMEEWLDDVIQTEKADIPDKVFNKIVSESNGHPRAALGLLEKVIDLDPKDMLDAAEHVEENETAAIDLVRTIMKKGSKWTEIAPLIKGLTDYENARWTILGYCETILLSGKDDPNTAKAALVMSYMDKPFYDSKRPGFTFACYQIFMG